MITSYIKKLKLNILKIEKIEHENSLSSCIYKIILKDRSKVILKISYNETRFKRECYFLDRVKDKIKTPSILQTIEPSTELNGAILMEYIDGDLIEAKSLNNEMAFKMGELLAKTHSISSKYYGEAFDENAKSQTGIDLLKEYFNTSFSECKNHLDRDLLEKAKKYFYVSIKNIDKLDGPCIVHRDFKPGNIIVKEGEIKALIDWEIAKNSFAEEDFAQMEYLVWDKYPNTKKAFLKGYESIRKLPALELLMPILRICKAFGAIGFTIVRKTNNGPHKFVYDANLKFLQRFFQMPFKVQTQRLYIESLSDKDFEKIYSLQTDPKVMKYIGGVKTKEQSKEAFSKLLNHQKKYGFSLGCVFIKDSDEFIGVAGLIHRELDETKNEIEVGYWLFPKYWKKGYATELAAACLKWGFENLTIEKIAGMTYPENRGSQNVLKKLGMNFTSETTYRGTKVFHFEVSKDKFYDSLKK